MDEEIAHVALGILVARWRRTSQHSEHSGVEIFRLFDVVATDHDVIEQGDFPRTLKASSIEALFRAGQRQICGLRAGRLQRVQSTLVATVVQAADSSSISTSTWSLCTL